MHMYIRYLLTSPCTYQSFLIKERKKFNFPALPESGPQIRAYVSVARTVIASYRNNGIGTGRYVCTMYVR